jgi:hypothetical protein
MMDNRYNHSSHVKTVFAPQIRPSKNHSIGGRMPSKTHPMVMSLIPSSHDNKRHLASLAGQR